MKSPISKNYVNFSAAKKREIGGKGSTITRTENQIARIAQTVRKYLFNTITQIFTNLFNLRGKNDFL
mgnify:CR=1 FL=1